MQKNRYAGIRLLSLLLALFMWQCAGFHRQAPFRFDNNVASRNILVDSTTSANPDMEALISPYRQKLNKVMGKIVGHAAVDLYRGKPEAPLNNFVADLMLRRANREFPETVHVAITNVGGLRTNIPAGPITLGKIYEVMPFENELVILEMTGSQLITLGKQIGEVHGECIAGMQLEFTGERLTRIRVQGQKVNPEKIYRVVTTDYLSSPGRRKLKILGEVPRKFLGIKLRDAILDEVKAWEARGEPITAKVEGRIVFKESTSAGNGR